MVMISVTVYTCTATCLGATISGLKLVTIGKNRAISSFLSGLKFKKIAKNQAIKISSFLAGLKFMKIANNRARN